MVGSARADEAAAPDQSTASRLAAGHGGDAFWSRWPRHPPLRGPVPARHRLRRWPAVGAAGEAGLRRHRHRSSGGERADRVRPCGRGRRDGRLSRGNRRDPRDGRGELRCRPGDGGHRACAGPRRLRRDGREPREAWRPADGLHHQPHQARLRPRDPRRGIHPALAAGGHPQLGPLRHAGGVHRLHPGQRPRRLRALRHGLQPARRPLVAVARHGGQLHAGGDRRGKAGHFAQAWCVLRGSPSARTSG